MKFKFFFFAYMFLLVYGSIDPAASQTPAPTTAPAPALVSFEKTDDADWPYSWKIAVPPDVAQTNQFQIRSQLRDPDSVPQNGKFGFDKDLLSMVLAGHDEIQENPKDPVNIKYRLNPLKSVNPYDPHLEIASGFSRVASFVLHANVPATFKAYGTSGPFKMLGNKITDVHVGDDKIFQGPRLNLVTITTTDGTKSYIYDVFLEKLPLPSIGTKP